MAPTLTSFVNSFSNRLEPPVRQHLKNVYGCLSLTTISAASGAYINMYTNFLQGEILPSIAALGLLFALMFTPDNGKNRHLRLGYLLGFSFFSGLKLGPLLSEIIRFDPSIIVSALMGTAVVFVSFSISSLLAERGKFLYLGGTLISVLNMMILFSLINLFTRSVLIHNLQMYLGLAVMCGFVIYDTQLIVEKNRLGSKDYIGHALELFIDLFGIFRRLLILLTDKSQKSKKSERN